jgi:hypothetical protein
MNRLKTILRKIPKREQESYVNSITDLTVKTALLSTDDYQAPLTSYSLSPTSKWLIVRDNIHKIRNWGDTKGILRDDDPSGKLYRLLQMRRELKRAEDHIRAIQYRPDFIPIRHFELHINEKKVKRYNVSDVQPTDGIYYRGLGSEPIVLQNLLYYFNKECPVPYGSIFHSFLSDVIAVLYTNRERLKRVAVFRRLALFVTITFSVILFLMFISLILSVITTISNFKQMYKNDYEEEMKWHRPESAFPTTLIYKH